VYIPKFDNVNGNQNTDYRYGWAVQGTIGRMPVPKGSAGVVGLMAFGEMPAYAENSITLHKWRKDAWGVPIPRIRLAITENEKAIMKAQVAGLREMAEAAGYRVNFAGSALGLDSLKVWPKANPISRLLFILAFKKSMAMGAAIHECGGARMGDNPETSVTNSQNQLWDVPNVYVTDAAAFVTNGSVGPTLTIMALTARAADHIVSKFKKGKNETGFPRI
jgi:choline dehydrogenase-like flavoprotein